MEGGERHSDCQNRDEEEKMMREMNEGRRWGGDRVRKSLSLIAVFSVPYKHTQTPRHITTNPK